MSEIVQKKIKAELRRMRDLKNKDKINAQSRDSHRKAREALTEAQKTIINEKSRIAYAKKNALTDAENDEISVQWIDFGFDKIFTDPKLSFRRKRYIIRTELKSHIS